MFKSFDIHNQARLSVKELRQALDRAGCCLNDEEFNDIKTEFKLKIGDYMDFEIFRNIMMCFSEENSEKNSLNTEEFSPRQPRRRFLSQKKLSVRHMTLLPDLQSVFKFSYLDSYLNKTANLENLDYKN